MERGMALKSIKIRKLGIENLEQVLHIQEIMTRNKIGSKKTSYQKEKNQTAIQYWYWKKI